MKKLIIALLCILAVLAVVSCNQDPKKETVKETEPYYRLTATQQAKRFSFKYVGGTDGINPAEDDVLTLKFRSSHPVTHFYLRDEDGSSTSVFAKKSDITKYISEPDANGWITFSFIYPKDENDGKYPVSGFLLELANYTEPETGRHDEGLGKFEPGDWLDIKDFRFNDDELIIEEEEVIKTGTHGIWNNDNGDQTLPTLEEIKP